MLYLPADMVVDPTTNRLYVADGYGNRRILIVDADTGKYIGHFGAYGSNPVDDTAAAAGGRWLTDYLKGNKKPAFFRNPVHCVKVANDGKIYVCDRGNNRVQVFDRSSPELGKPCSNPTGDRGQVRLSDAESPGQREDRHGPARHRGLDEFLDGYGAELSLCRRQYQHDHLSAQSQQPAGAGPVGPFGPHVGRVPLAASGQPGQVKGDIYTAEVDTGKRIQKFIRYGAAGCSGTGSATVGGVLK